MSNAESRGRPAQSAGPPINLPAHDPALKEQSIENARKFYRVDEQLSAEDRRQLASYFWQKTTLYPALGIPVLWGFVQAPNWLKRRAIIPANKNYRYAQFALGFVGLFVGLQFGMGVGSVVHTAQLNSKPVAQQAYIQLSMYPPQLGSRYYSMTAKHPDLALKDPDTIDWKNNPLFPFCLIMNRKIIEEWKQADKGRIDRYKALEQQRNQERMQRISSASSGSNNGSSPEPTGTSWDNVIAKNRQQEQQQQQQPKPSAEGSDLSDLLNPPALDAPTQPSFEAPKPRSRVPKQTPSVSSQELGTDGLIDGLNVNQTDFTGNVEEDQKRFDELVERERQGSYIDDFSASEKKW